jgi:hypothetical protein
MQDYCSTLRAAPARAVAAACAALAAALVLAATAMPAAAQVTSCPSGTGVSAVAGQSVPGACVTTSPPLLWLPPAPVNPGLPAGTPPAEVPSAAKEENVPAVQQPDYSRLPLFEQFFQDPGGNFARQGNPADNVSVAVGDGHVFVASENTKRLSEFDGGVTPTFIDAAQLTTAPRGVAYYRGELYVAGNDRAVHVYDAGPGHTERRRFPVGYLGNPTGVDTAWGEVWVSFQGGPGGGVVVALDSTTGAILGVTWHTPRYDCSFVPSSPLAIASNVSNCANAMGLQDPASPATTCKGFLAYCMAIYADSRLQSIWNREAWWDLSTVPELSAVAAQCRFIDRGPLLTATAHDEISLADATGTSDCTSGRFQDGIDAVWGMSWMLTVSGSDTAAGSSIEEYTLAQPALDGSGRMALRRRWTTQDSTSNNHRDVAYQNRQARIDWTGHLTQSDWQESQQCLDYVVSDADIYVAGFRGERYYELARGFQNIQFKLSGPRLASPVTVGSSTSPAGTFCFGLNQYPSDGGYSLTATASINNGTKILTKTNPALRIDHDPPSGALDSLARFVRDTVTVNGAMADAHSGPRDWQLEVSGPGTGGAWQAACGRQTQPGSGGKYGCGWNTGSGYPDGTYQLRAQHRDAVDAAFAGPNAGYSATISTTVDNTPPAVSASGDLWDDQDLPPIHPGDPQPVHVAASDGGSGMKQIDIQIDGITRDTTTQACAAGGCSMARDWSFDASGYDEGQHTVNVIATDQLGHQANTSWAIDVEATGEAPPDATSEGTAAATATRADLSGPSDVALPDPTVVPDAPTTGTPADSLPCAFSDATSNFPVFSVGPSFETLPVTDVVRHCELPNQNGPDEGRSDYVSYIYGDCVVPYDPISYGAPSCTAPIEVQSWPACVRNLAQLALDPEWASLDYTQITLDNGVPALRLEGGTQLEVLTGTSTIDIYGDDVAQVLRVANALQQQPTGTLEVVPQSRAAADLPVPAPGAQDGTLPCG